MVEKKWPRGSQNMSPNKRSDTNTVTFAKNSKWQQGSIKLDKIGLSPFDNKRYILGNRCVTLAKIHCAEEKITLVELIELLADL